MEQTWSIISSNLSMWESEDEGEEVPRSATPLYSHHHEMDPQEEEEEVILVLGEPDPAGGVDQAEIVDPAGDADSDQWWSDDDDEDETEEDAGPEYDEEPPVCWEDGGVD